MSIPLPTTGRVARNADLNCTSHQLPSLANLTLIEAQDVLSNQPDTSRYPAYGRMIPASAYQLNSNAAIALWKDSELTCAENLLNKVLCLGSKPLEITPLLPERQTLRLIGYQNNWRSKQRDLLRFIEPGEWYLGTSHHNPTQRIIDHYSLRDSAMSVDLLRLSIDHVRHYVGICDTAHRAGVVATDTPRHYANRSSAGHVNPKQHPSLLWRLRFPSTLSAAEQRAYINNIRTWSMLIQKVAQFAPNPDGSEVLYHDQFSKVLDFGSQVLTLLQAGRKTVRSPLDMTHINNSEANVYLPLTLGLNVPLNHETLTRLYGEEAWFLLQRIVRDGRAFWRNGRYPDAYNNGALGYVLHSEQSRMVRLELAPDWLKPFSDQLILKPWDSTELLFSFLHTLLPDWDTKNWEHSHLQAELVTYLKPALLQAWGINERNATNQALQQQMDNLVTGLRHTYLNHAELMQRLAPTLEAIQALVVEHGMGNGYFLSPLHILALTRAPQDQLGMELMGELFHIDVLDKV